MQNPPFLSPRLLAFWLALSLSAQPEPEPPPVTLRFLFLEEGNARYAMDTGDGLQPVSSFPYAISPPVPVPRGETRDIVRLLPPLPEDGPGAPPRKQKIGEVEAPANADDVLVVMAPGGQEGLYRTRIYNSSEKAFPATSLRVINLCGNEIAVETGGILHRIAPWNLAVLPTAPDGRNRVLVKVALNNDGTWAMLYDSIQFIRPNERVTGVVVFSPSGMRHTYTEAELEDFGGTVPPRHQWLTYSQRIDAAE